MCGRVSVVSALRTYEKRFNAAFAKADDFKENVNIGPGQQVPVITMKNPDQIQMFTYGFTPRWAHKQTYIMNARAEGSHNEENKTNYKGKLGIFQKPMFREVIHSQRCLVLVDAVIEGSKYEKLNKPNLVYNSSSRPFALAGVYDVWKNPLTQEIHHTVAIITTAANDLMHKINHHRAPLALNKRQEKQWLDTKTSINELKNIMRPFKTIGFNAHPISNKIKNIKNRGLELLKPTGEKLYNDLGRTLFSEFKFSDELENEIYENRLTAGDQFVLF